MLRVLFVYALSGFVALGYQVTWFRIFTDWFGSTTFTFAVVVSTFIGGLGTGSLISAPATRFITRRTGLVDALRVYGLVEIAIALVALLTVLVSALPADLPGTFPYRLEGGFWVPSAGFRAGQALIGIACVFIPCTLMGITFPLLCNAFIHAPGGSRFPARLYAWNTLGACAGILACQFVFILWLGHGPTFLLMAAVNLLIGIYFLRTGGAPAAPPAGSNAAGSLVEQGSYWTLLVLALLSGFIAGALEGDLFKRVSFLMGAAPGATMTFVSFWAVLGIFLASTAVYRLPKLGLGHIKLGFLVAVAWYVLAWEYRYEIAVALEDPRPPTYFPSSLETVFLFAGVFAFVPFFLFALLLPFVCNRLQADRWHLGLAYGLNTLAFCAGLLCFCLIAPSVSIFYSLTLCVSILALGALFLVSVTDLRTVPRWQLPAFVALTALVVFLTPRGFDRNAFYPNEPLRTVPVTALMANPAHTTFVADLGNSDVRLYFDSHSMSGTNRPSQEYMRLMAHVPLLAQDQPKTALLICFGVGNTASAIAAHRDLERIDVVDLNRNVFLTAPVFGQFSNDVHLDPRLRLINDDGRGYLARTTATYDLITSEPPPPMQAGVYRLYSQEYYETALAHLTPGGMMSQWLPIYQLPQEAADLVIRTFVAVFPHALLFVGAGDELVLVGGREPFSIENAIWRMGREPSVVTDLAKIGVTRPNDLRLRVVAEDAELRRLYGTGRVLRDPHNDLEQLFLTPENRAVYGRVKAARTGEARSGRPP